MTERWPRMFSGAAAALRSAPLSVLAPGGGGARLSILIFHRVLAEPDPLFPDEMHARSFDAVCRWVADWFRVLPLDEAVQRLRSGTLPSRALAITFDDGYADNCEIALPILQRHRLPAAFFVATGFLDGGRMWNDTIIECVRQVSQPTMPLRGTRFEDLGALPVQDLPSKRKAIQALIGHVKYLPPEERLQAVAQLERSCGSLKLPLPMLRSDQVREMRRAGMQIGAHTVHHPILARLQPQQALEEIRASKATLEGLLGEAVTLFAYPNGKPDEDYHAGTVQLVRDCGFDAAVSTSWGVSRPDSDMFQLPRFTPWDRTRWRFGARMARNLVSAPAARANAAAAGALP